MAARKIFLLSEYGARYDLGYTAENSGRVVTPQMEIHRMWLVSICFSQRTIQLERLCALLAIGDDLQVEEHCVPDFHWYLFQLSDRTVFEKIIQSGYRSFFRPGVMESVACGSRECEEKYRALYKRYNQPLKLLHLASNVVRTRLQPNAVVGEKILIARGEIPEVLRHVITLGLSREDFDSGVLINKKCFEQSLYNVRLFSEQV